MNTGTANSDEYHQYHIITEIRLVISQHRDIELLNKLKSSKGLLTWSITAFKGGKISKLTKNFLHIPTLNMEIAEDIQLIIFHYIKTKLVEIFYRDKECRKILNNDKYFKRTILDQIS